MMKVSWCVCLRAGELSSLSLMVATVARPRASTQNVSGEITSKLAWLRSPFWVKGQLLAYPPAIPRRLETGSARGVLKGPVTPLPPFDHYF